MSKESAYQRTINRWMAYNLLQQGKDTGSEGSNTYKGAVFYYQDYPCMRLIKHKSRWVVLIKSYGITTMPSFAKDRVVKVTVPDLAVFSHYPGDMLSDEETHGRVQYIMLMQVGEKAEEAQSKDGAFLSKKRNCDNLIKHIDNCYDRWAAYSKAFDLGWPPMPAVYVERTMDVIKQRVDAYNDPKAVAQRERQKARANAKVALGLAK